MRPLHAAGFAAVLAATALMTPGGASAAQPKVVSGEFGGKIIYQQPCTGSIPTGDADGSWSITLNSASTAKGTFDITGHVAYTFPGMKQAPGSTATDFVVYGKTAAGLLTVTVTEGDSMTYKIAPYHDPFTADGLSCASVTWQGHASPIDQSAHH